MKQSLHRVEQVVKEFLEEKWNGQSPLLIAYSGGPDSKALLYAVLRQVAAHLIHVAHVDHGWRKESAEEALSLEKEVRGLGISFHTKRLGKKTTEEEARLSRLAFFRTLSEIHSFQAVLLGHQGDELAETVLKRIFEGAHLTRLFGMSSVSSIEELTLWRPLLSVRKIEIEHYLSKKKLVAFSDASNSDPRYLRARMRTDLIPALSVSFGKEVTQNLMQFAERSRELNDYLSDRIQERKRCVARGPFGLWVDAAGIPRMELRQLLQNLAREESLVFSRSVLETVLDWIASGRANQRISLASRRMVIDRGHFFLLAPRMPLFRSPIPLGSGRSGDWMLEEGEGEALGLGWKGLWRGDVVIARPEGTLILQLPSGRLPGQEKVPAFLRAICPVLMQGTQVKGNFLTGEKRVMGRFVKLFIHPEQPFYQEDESASSGQPIQDARKI